jgi:hypothetical protein
VADRAGQRRSHRPRASGLAGRLRAAAGGGPVLDPAGGRCGQGRDRRPTPAHQPAQAGQRTRRAGQGSRDQHLTASHSATPTFPFLPSRIVDSVADLVDDIGDEPRRAGWPPARRRIVRQAAADHVGASARTGSHRSAPRTPPKRPRYHLLHRHEPRRQEVRGGAEEPLKAIRPWTPDANPSSRPRGAFCQVRTGRRPGPPRRPPGPPG